jgi:hypothetical protein
MIAASPGGSGWMEYAQISRRMSHRGILQVNSDLARFNKSERTFQRVVAVLYIRDSR